MATEPLPTPDPGMLTDWYKSYMQTAPQATGYTPTQATTTDWAPGTDSTVAGQVQKITAAGGPLMDQAATAAKQQQNERGLLNSSIAITAGQDALYRTALPIAQQDANTFASAGQFNAGARNTASLNNAGFANDASRFTAGAGNDAVTQQRAAGITTEQARQQQAFQASQQAIQNDLAIRQQQLQESGMDARQAQQLALQERQQASQQTFQAAQQTIQNEFALRQQQLQESGMDTRQATQLAMQESLAKLQEAGVSNRFDAQLALQSQQFDFEQAAADRRSATEFSRELEKMGYQNSLANANVPSQFAASVSANTLQQVNAALADPNLSPEAKKAAVDNIVNYANSTMAWAEKFYGVTLPDMTVPGATPSGSPAPAPAPAAPAPAPGMTPDGRPISQSEYFKMFGNEAG